MTFFVLLPNFKLLDDTTAAYQPVPTDIIPESLSPEATLPPALPPSDTKPSKIHLSTSEKIQLLKPLMVRYMLPLCAVYIEEYVINSVGSADDRTELES